MAIIRLEPFRDADALRYRLDKLFDGTDATRIAEWNRQENWRPAVEVRETDEAVILQVALPGLKAEDVDVHVSQGAVLISGEYSQKESQDGDRLVSSEFLYGRFRRVIPLGVKVKHTEADGDLSDGLLTMSIPKLTSERDQMFRVKLGEPQVAQSVDLS